MSGADELSEYADDKTVLICSEKLIGKYNKPYAIFINKYTQEGDERTIEDIANQLKIYFKSSPTEYYYIEKNLKIDISPKSKLTPYKTIWINY